MYRASVFMLKNQGAPASTSSDSSEHRAVARARTRMPFEQLQLGLRVLLDRAGEIVDHLADQPPPLEGERCPPPVAAMAQPAPARRSCPGELRDHRPERLPAVAFDRPVGDAVLLASPLQLLGHLIERAEEGQRDVERVARGRSRSVGAMASAMPEASSVTMTNPMSALSSRSSNRSPAASFTQATFSACSLR